MNKLNKLTYIAPISSSFIFQDIDKLKKKADVTTYFFEVKRKATLPLRMLHLFLFLLLKGKSNYLISFGGYHSFTAVCAARVNRSKTYIILNGTDSADIPEFSYGLLRGGLIKWCCHYSYNNCTRLLPVSASLVETENTYAFKKPKKIGLNKSLPNNNFQYTVIPNGFDLNFWEPAKVEKELGSFLTVCSTGRYELKGVDLIFQVAAYFKNYIFYLAGVSHFKEAPENVHFLGYLNKEQLRSAYSKAQFYLQLSIWEGFGCSLCEAMLCECIPIVSNVNILPELAGDKGYILEKRSAERLKELINTAVKSTEKDVSNLRDHITNNYTIDARIDHILRIIFD